MSWYLPPSLSPPFIFNPLCPASTDVDECESARGGCGQLCNNTIGSFFCDCMSGYSLDENQFNCSGLLCVCVYVGSRHLHCLQTLMSVLMTH